MTIFTEADLDQLEGPHVQRAWFADIRFPAGRRRVHTGYGTVTIGGHEWEGVNDPFGAQAVQLGNVQEARFGEAPAVSVVISGANRAFLKEMWDTDLEGVPCDLYFAVFDGETGGILIDLRLLFEGRLTGFSFDIQGLGVRAVTSKIVSRDEGRNFPATRWDWSPAGQRSRYPDDAGMDFVGSDIQVDFKA
ncbi:MAG: transcriptional regulator [Pseudomonadota bacterium]